MKKVWLFDMDGLLVDTERLHVRFWKEVLPGDPKLIDELLHHTLGTNGEMAKDVAERYTGDRNFMVRHNAEKEKRMRAYVDAHGLMPKKGAVHLLTYLKNHQDTCIVVSSSSYQDVRYALKKAGLDGFFTCYVCGDQVEKTKPDPAIYLKALADYQIKKEEAVVLEDSINGIKAARAADIDVIGIPDLVAIDHLAGDHVAIYASLEDVFSQLSHDSFHLFEK